MNVSNIDKPLTRVERRTQNKEGLGIKPMAFQSNRFETIIGKQNKNLVSLIFDDYFKSNIFGKEHKFIGSVVSDTKNILTWRNLNQILNSNNIGFPRLFLEINKQKIDPSEYSEKVQTLKGEQTERLNPIRLQQFIKEGATLVINRIDEFQTSIFDLCKDISQIFFVPIHANLYLSSGEKEGFGLHWDDHDVLVLQIEGTKKWEINGFSRKFPLFRDSKDANHPNGKSTELLLKKGDALYIPRGLWHKVTSIGEPSLHLTFSINTLTGIDLLKWVSDNLLNEQLFRENLPLFGTEGERRDYIDEISILISNQLRNYNIIDNFFDFNKANYNPKPNYSLPLTISSETNNKYIFTGAYAILNTSNQSHIEYYSLGKVWTFEIGYKELVKHIVEGNEFTIAEIENLVESSIRNQVKDLIYQLLNGGFLMKSQ